MKTALNCRQKTLGEPVYKFDVVKSPTSPTGFVWWCRCTLFHPHHRTTEGVAIDKSDVLVRGSAHWLEEGRGRRQVQVPAGPPPNTNSDLESLYNWLYYEDSEEEENPFRVNEQPLFNWPTGQPANWSRTQAWPEIFST